MSGRCCIQMSHKRLYTNIKRCTCRLRYAPLRFPSISNKRLRFPSLARSEIPFISKQQLFSSLAIPERNARCQGFQEKKNNPKIHEQFSDIFKGISKIRDKNDEDFYAKFSMKPEEIPVAQRPRPVAYYLQEQLKKWLRQCLEEGIFEQVPEGEPVTWCPLLVAQPKPKICGTAKDLEPQVMKASVDLRISNQYMERHRITQGILVEDFMYKFHDCTVSSKLDMRQGYHQLLLDPESRKVATFSTPWGNLRPERLIFGAKSSQDLFDEAIYRIFGDITRCLT